MARERFSIAPVFGVRLAGVPFDVLERLGTCEVSAAARRVNALATELAGAAAAAVAAAPDTLARNVRSKIESKLRRHAAIAPELVAEHPWLAAYARLRAAHAEGVAELERRIVEDYAALDEIVVREAARELPDFVLLESPSLLPEIARLAEAAGTRHASQDRRQYRTLALYLQRVCAKNETFSRFGPIGWGRVVPGDGVVVQPLMQIAARRAELELWVVEKLVDTIAEDPAIRDELAPRLHPHGRLEGDAFVRLDEQRTIELSSAQRALAERCDGVTPAHALGDVDVLAELGVVVWKLEIYARDAAPLASLLADIEGWRDAARTRWLPRLAPLAALVERFAADVSVDGRRAILAELRGRLDDIGIGERDRTRTLYAAMNPINENCAVEGELSIGTRAAERLLDDAWPWLALWSDSVALAADRIYARMKPLVDAAPRRDYASLAHAARAQKLDIEHDQLQIRVARETYDEIKRGLAARLAHRADAPEWQLDAEDCLFLRAQHVLPPAGELGLPSLDLLASASSVEAARAGELQWIIGETHLALVMLQHGTYWSCPDKPALHAGTVAAIGHGRVAARDAGNATHVHSNAEALLAATGAAYVGRARPKPGWKVVRPADAEVVVDEERRDIRLRAPSGEDLGSLVRVPPLAMGMHPFFPFERPPHEPRLRLGNVVVQRQAWYVEAAALDDKRPTGVSAAFVTAIERLRAERGIPRWVYARPWSIDKTNYLLRDKDNKPICFDLESVISLDILERRLRKYPTMVLTEMLPAPDQLVCKTTTGRYVFELRTNVIRD